MGVDSLPKTVTRQRRGCNLNPGPTAPGFKVQGTFSWTDPPSLRPPRWVFWLVRPHKLNNKVSNPGLVESGPVGPV